MSKPSFVNIVCQKCGHPGADLCLLGCKCCLHARCTPLSVVVQSGGGPIGIPTPVTSKQLPCPVCHQGYVTGVHLFPMNFDDLDRAVELRKESARAARKADGVGKKRAREEDDEDAIFHQIQAESSYLLLSHTRTSVHQNQRTGRWSTEEVSFVDQLVSAFDRGTLPLPHGVKLNEFLGDMLLCKSSRLTKKMKNAKLSTRNYSIKNAGPNMASHDCSLLSALQLQFFQSIPSEAMQLELLFNMTKFWRLHFSNLCLQVGYEMLNARDWLASLEEMESRATKAEELIRKARRKRMGLALKKDVGESANHGVYIGGNAARELTIHSPPQTPPVAPTPVAMMLEQQKNRDQSSDKQAPNDEIAFLADVLGVGGASVSVKPQRPDDFNLENYVDPLTLVPTWNHRAPQSLGDCGPFLEKVVNYMETEGLPFEHVDVWVPSYLQNGQTPLNGDGNSTLRLFHAGHATRHDIPSSLAFQLHEYGVYSTNFSFAPGVGLPGRVYTTGKPSFERKLYDADPAHFERAGGAKVYGVKTAVGIPLSTANIGRIVLAMYSSDDLPDQAKSQMDDYVASISQWCPEPRWKLTIEVGDEAQAVQESDDEIVTAPSTANPQSGAQAMYASKPPAPNLGIQNATGSPHEVVHKNSSALKPLAATSAPASGASPSPHYEDDEEDQKIATLLGDHMPSAQDSSMVPSQSSPGSLLPHFMSLRLLLLKASGRRTPDENELLDILKKSFRGYTKDNRRTGAELASLLAKDWTYLSGSIPPVSPHPIPAQSQKTTISLPQHRCHVLQAPSIQTISATGAPLNQMPSQLMTNAVPPPVPPQPLRLISHHHVATQAINSTDYASGNQSPARDDGGERSRSVSDDSTDRPANLVPES